MSFVFTNFFFGINSKSYRIENNNWSDHLPRFSNNARGHTSGGWLGSQPPRGHHNWLHNVILMAMASYRGRVIKFWFKMIHRHNHWIDDHNLIPRNKKWSDLSRKWRFSKCQCYSSATVNHEIEPTILLGHSVTFGMYVSMSDPYAGQTSTGSCNNTST